MDALTGKMNMDFLRNAVDDAVTRVKPKNDTEKRVHEALTNENWGASSTTLNEIAQDTFDYEKFQIVMKILWAAMDGNGRSWRQVFKSLTLVEHLIKNGTERMVG